MSSLLRLNDTPGRVIDYNAILAIANDTCIESRHGCVFMLLITQPCAVYTSAAKMTLFIDIFDWCGQNDTIQNPCNVEENQTQI